MGFQIQPGEFLGIGLSGPVEEETLVFGDQVVDAGRPQVFDAAQVDGEELCGDFRVGVGVLGVGHEDERGTLAAQGGASGDLPALVGSGVHMRRPQGHEVADAVFKGRKGLRLIHVLDGHFSGLYADGIKPRGECEVGGGNRGAEDGLAPHVLWAPEYVGMLGVEALSLEDGIVGPGEHGDAGGLVGADADDAGAVAQVPHHGRNPAEAGILPFTGG